MNGSFTLYYENEDDDLENSKDMIIEKTDQNSDFLLNEFLKNEVYNKIFNAIPITDYKFRLSGDSITLEFDS